MNIIRHSTTATATSRSRFILRGFFDLYPLHKRILGLVEYIIVPQIKARPSNLRTEDEWFVGPASVIYSDAFTGQFEPTRKRGNYRLKVDKLCRATLDRYDGIRASLETEGNWLIISKEQEKKGYKGPLSLASMLDDLVAMIISPGGVKDIPITLRPADPSEQAKQLANVSAVAHAPRCPIAPKFERAGKATC